jgi:hypothetical protein
LSCPFRLCLVLWLASDVRRQRREEGALFEATGKSELTLGADRRDVRVKAVSFGDRFEGEKAKGGGKGSVPAASRRLAGDTTGADHEPL